MGKGLLLFVGGMMMAGTMLVTGGVQYGVQGANARLADHQAEVLAREIALTGMSDAEDALFATEGLPLQLVAGQLPGSLVATPTLQGEYMGGTYDVSYEILENPDAEEEEEDEGLLDIVDDVVGGLGGWLGIGGVPDVVDDVTDVVEDVVDGLLGCNEVTTASTSVKVRSTGSRPMLGEDLSAIHTIETTYEVGTGSLPSYLEFALLVNGNLTLEDNARIISTDVNANIHTNGDFLRTGSDHEVMGLGTYAGAAMPSWDMDDVFAPVENPQGQPSHQQVNPIAMPEINMADLRAQATQIVSGNMVLDSAQELVLGSLLEPALLYIEGDLVISDSVSVLGYGTLIVEGDVRISNDISLNLSLGCLSLGLNLFVYSGGDVEISSGLVSGQFVVANDFIIEEDAELRGSVVALGDVVLRDNATLIFSIATPTLADPFGAQIMTTDMRQWSYRK